MLSDKDRATYYMRLGLSPSTARLVEEMRRASPARDVGKGALLNSTVYLASSLNGDRRCLESMTCENVFAMEQEVFGVALEYWPQVGLRGVERRIGGRRHVASATVDFMVFEPDRIGLVECKPLEKILRLVAEKPEEWVQTGEGWNRPPLMAWAREHGLTYEVWSPPDPFGVYLANLQLLLALKGVQRSRSEVAIIERLRRRVEQMPHSLEEALNELSGLTPRLVAAAIADQKLYGTIVSTGLDNHSQFWLYAEAERARQADADALAKLNASLGQPITTSPVLLAGKTDHSHGQRRLARVKAILAGEAPLTRRYRPLVRAVRRAIADRRPPLEVCLTNYAQCGRRMPQLSVAQEIALTEVVRDHQAGRLRGTKQDLMFELEARCQKLEISPPSKTSLRKRLKSVRPELVALHTHGKRAFHAARPPVDPAKRSLTAIAPFLVANVDSTKFDNRCDLEVLASLGFDCPTLYVAMDAATGMPIGRALLFGAACRDALAILMRDIVHRHGVLPRTLITDGGSEYTGHWFNEFCEALGITRIKPPSGAPRHNSLAENALGRINRQLAHRLLGSTDPDKQGRKTDSKFKSYRTARHTFSTLVQELDRYLFEDVPITPIGMVSGTPQERLKDLRGEYGQLGIEVAYDDDFRILTSIPLDRDRKVVPEKGIRHEGRTYSSQALSTQLRSGKPIEQRRDCVDPSRMYVKFASGWVIAFSSDAQRIQGASEIEQLFDSMFGQQIRREKEQARLQVARGRNDRLTRANASAPATVHLPKASPRPKPQKQSDRLMWFDTDEDLKPYEVQMS